MAVQYDKLHIITNYPTFGPTSSEGLHSQSITILKLHEGVKFHTSYKNRQIKMVVYYDQLHIMTNHPTKYENYQTNDFRGVAFTK